MLSILKYVVIVFLMEEGVQAKCLSYLALFKIKSLKKNLEITDFHLKNCSDFKNAS